VRRVDLGSEEWVGVPAKALKALTGLQPYYNPLPKAHPLLLHASPRIIEASCWKKQLVAVTPAFATFRIGFNLDRWSGGLCFVSVTMIWAS
jgi:hypothetical protein